MRLTFGKHKGQDVADLPTDYLLWIQSVQIQRPYWLQGAVESELRRRHGRRTQQRTTHQPHQQTGVCVGDAVRRWYGKLAMAHHPDRGGSDERMQLVNS